jgi:hypothetical protein
VRYSSAPVSVVRVYREFNPQKSIPEPPALPGPGERSWAKEFELWTKEANFRVPTRVETASALIERADFAASDVGTDDVKQTHTRLCQALGTSNLIQRWCLRPRTAPCPATVRR